LHARAAVTIDAPATIASLVPTQLHRIVEGRASLPPGLRVILLGGAPAPPALVARSPVPVVTTYGLTEACGTVALAGVPLPGVEVRISPEGTIQLDGPTLMSGYLHDPSPFTPDGWLDTGDLGALDAAGRLEIFARRTDLILSGGENVYPSEVEGALSELPGIAAACVFGVPDPEWGQVVCAALVGDRASDPVAQLRDRLAPFKLPRRIVWVDALPLNPAGKIDRGAARDLLGPGGMPKRQKNEGEGSKTAAKEYDDKASKFAGSGQVDDKAKEARRAIDGDEGDDLREAEREGKSKIADEDPEVSSH